MTLDTLRGHGKTVFCVEAINDRLVTGGEDKKIRVWSVNRRKCLATLRGHTKAVTAIRQQQHGNGDWLISGGAEGIVRLWELSGKGKQIRMFESGVSNGGIGGVSSVDLCDSNIGLSSSLDGVVNFWDLESGKSTLRVQCDSEVLCARLDGPQRALWTCADGSIRVSDSRTRGETGALLGHTREVRAMQLGRRLTSSQGDFVTSELICSASSDGTVKLWDVRHLKSYSTLKCGVVDEELYCVDFDGSVVATAGKSRTLHLFDLASEEPIRSLKNHHADIIHGVSVSDGRVFTCSADKTCKLLTSAPVNKVQKSRGTPSFLRLNVFDK